MDQGFCSAGDHFENSSQNDIKIEKNEFGDSEMDDSMPQSTTTSTEDDMYDVEQIVGMKKVDGHWFYKIRWKGYGKASDTWEPQENLAQCMDMIAEFKSQQQLKRRKNRRIATASKNRTDSCEVIEDTFSEDATDSLPSNDSKLTQNESQPDTFWKDLAEGRIPIRDEDMYSNVKGRRAKKNQNAQDSKTPSNHSSTSNDDSADRNISQSRDNMADLNLGVLQTLSHFFDNSLHSINRLRKPQKDRLYRSCSKLSRGRNKTNKTSIMRVERVSCASGKLMLKIKGHKAASCSYSSPKSILSERKIQREKISSTCTNSCNIVPVQNEPILDKASIKAESHIPASSNLLKELFSAVEDRDCHLVDGLFKLYRDQMGLDQITFSSVVHQLLLEALSIDDWSIMDTMLKNGGDVNSTSSDGTTILMTACQNANYEVVQKLLDNGAYKDKQNSLGMTALMIACTVGDSDSVYKLLNSGANFVIVNRSGMSVLKLAKQAKNPKIQNILTKHVSRLKAAFETEVRNAVFNKADIMHALFPLNCYTLNEQDEIKITFDYKKELDTESVLGDGYIIFIANLFISATEVSCKLDGINGACLVKWVVLNNKKQELISVGTKIGYSCMPLHEGRNVLLVLTEESNKKNVKLLICAYKVRLETRS